MAGEFNQWMASGYSDVSDGQTLKTIRAAHRNGIDEVLRVMYAAINYRTRPIDTIGVANTAGMHRTTADSILKRFVVAGFARELAEDEYPEDSYAATVLRLATDKLFDLAGANNGIDTRLIQARINGKEPGITEDEVVTRSIKLACIGIGHTPVAAAELSGLAAERGAHEATILHDGLEALAEEHNLPLHKIKLRLLASMPQDMP